MCHGWPKVYFLIICNNGYVTEEIELKLRTIESPKIFACGAILFIYELAYDIYAHRYAYVCLDLVAMITI